MRNGPRLIDAIMPRVRQAVLSATVLQPDRWWYASQLARHLHLRPSSLQRELAALMQAGILRSRREGRMIFFQADPHSPIFKDLQSLLTKTAGLVDVLREVLAPLADRIICCFVYGSIARREERSASDVDLMIIGDVSLALVADALRPAREKLAREVNPRLYRPDEFAKRLAANDHFLTSVLKKPKLFVIGSPDALEQTAKRRPRGPRANQPDRAGQTALDRAAVLQ